MTYELLMVLEDPNGSQLQETKVQIYSVHESMRQILEAGSGQCR